MAFSAKGILPAMITPVDEAGNVNEIMQRRIIDHLISNGVHGIFSLGTTGEFYGISYSEYEKLVDIVIDQTAGRVPVYVGATGITTKEVLKLVEIVNRKPVQAISVLTPMFISPSDDELYEHYRIIASSTDLPILLYNNPDRTGVNLSSNVIARLSRIDNIVGIKDSSGNMTQFLEYIRRTRGENFHCLMGRDTLIYSALCAGGSGAVAACANVAPQLCVEIYDKYQSGDLQGALDAQFRLAPLRLAFSLGTFPAVIKEALGLLGIEVGGCMAPVKPLTTEEHALLKKTLVDMELLH